MSKPVKEMMIRDFQERLGDTEDALVISLRGISANDNNAIRKGLAKKEIRVTVVRNKLFGQAFADTNLSGLSEILKGSNAIAYGAESVVEVAREVVALVKEFPDIELKGAILDGMLFSGDAGVKELSKYPTRDEAIAQDVALILSPAREAGLRASSRRWKRSWKAARQSPRYEVPALGFNLERFT
jgi:large subunit ribosomal protein L10